MIDASIPLGVQQYKAPDQLNMLAQILQLQGMQDARTKEQRALDQQTAMNDAYSGALGSDGNLDRNKLYSLLAGRGQGSQIPTAQKLYSDLDKTQSETDKNKATATKDSVEAAHKRVDLVGQASGWLRQNPTAENALLVARHLQENGVLTPEQAQASIAKIQADPSPEGIARSATMAYQSALQAKDQLPKLTDFAAGDRHVNQSIDPVTGKVTETGSTLIGQSADNKATNATHVLTTGMNNATSVKTTGMTNATSTANNRATIQKDYNIAGIDPNGGGATQDLRQMAQAIADGKLQPPTGMALNHPRMQLLMNEVMKINPNFDATTYGAKAKAARDFTSGNQGNAMRSFQVAGQHLDQLGQLVDALGNNNMQIINKVGNMYATQTGNPAPTNFEAAKDVVSKEVVKAIVAGGGGVSERQELSNLMSQAKSPAQLKGVIQQYRNLMAAQHDALLQQRDAAGLPRSTLPNYTEPGGGGTAGTAGWSVIGVQPAKGGK